MSKAMRLLVTCKKLTKTGKGGRLTPYFYQACTGFALSLVPSGLLRTARIHACMAATWVEEHVAAQQSFERRQMISASSHHAHPGSHHCPCLSCLQCTVRDMDLKIPATSYLK